MDAEPEGWTCGHCGSKVAGLPIPFLLTRRAEDGTRTDPRPIFLCQICGRVLDRMIEDRDRGRPVGSPPLLGEFRSG